MILKKFMVSIVFILIPITSVFSQNWLTDFDTAKQTALEQNKKIVLVFSGSDWCAPCIKLEKEIWESQDFKDFAQSHYVLLRADFPRRKKNALSKTQQEHNNLLAETYNKSGYFPFVVMLDSKGNVLGETGYQKISPKKYIEILQSF